MTASREVAVCFLGNSGVGKSTLLNALISDKHDVLPHGGVGPLTAQATEVRHAEAPYFRATYVAAAALNKILFSLETWHERVSRRASAPAVDDVAASLDEDERREAEAAVPIVEPDAPAIGASDKVDAYLRQVRLLVRGDQMADMELPYLADALRVALGAKPRWGHTPSPEDAARLARVRACLSLAQREGARYERQADGDFGAFLTELREHASGFLAPLIKGLDVGFPADGLRDGLVLVDLPGVGVANDEYRSVTARWIGEARAIVLVVDHRGVSQAGADLLRTTGFLNRLLHGSDDLDADPVTISVVAVKIDEPAEAGWRDEKNLKGKAARRWGEHFAEACDQARNLVRGQMREELAKIAADGPDATRLEREAALQRVLETMTVHPVSAPQYRLFLLDDEEARPYIKAPEESRIPAVREALWSIAAAHQDRGRQRAEQAVEAFRTRLLARLTLVRAQWEQDTRAEREAQALREELEAFLNPRQKELGSRQGAFREFLREGVPREIESRVDWAALVAHDDISKYLRKLESLHWATLRAVVRRGGAFVRKNAPPLDLPAELTLRFEEPVAVVWSKGILAQLRKRTHEHGADQVALVSDVVAWARAQEARVQPRFVEALHDNLAAQTKDLSTVGKEAVDELKGKVRAELSGKLEKKIRKKCQAFVDDKKDEGPGTKRRIIEMFHAELAAGISDDARPVAKGVLLRNYQDVAQDIDKRFAEYRNPLESARDSIVLSHEDSLRRSDAQRRKRVLADVDAILDAMPRSQP